MKKILLLILLLSFLSCGENNSGKELNPISKERISNSIIADNIDFENIELGKELEVIGILSTGGNCMIPEGCGPDHKLFSSDMKMYLPLLGDFHNGDDEKLIIVKGKIVKLSSNDYKDINYRGPIIALEISEYEKFGNIKYHEYSIKKSTDYMDEKFGCSCRGPYDCSFSHNKTFGFKIEDYKPCFIVRWTYFTGEKRLEDKYIELWIDPLTGDITKEIDEIQEFNVCK